MFTCRKSLLGFFFEFSFLSWSSSAKSDWCLALVHISIWRMLWPLRVFSTWIFLWNVKFVVNMSLYGNLGKILVKELFVIVWYRLILHFCIDEAFRCLGWHLFWFWSWLFEGLLILKFLFEGFTSLNQEKFLSHLSFQHLLKFHDFRFEMSK